MKLDYDEISPITKNKSVLVEYTDNGFMKMCTESGYVTYEGLIDGSEIDNLFLATSPELLRSTRIIDLNTRQVWYRSVIVQGNVMLTPIEYDGDCMWAVGTWRKLYTNELLSDRYMIRYVKDDAGNEIPEIFDQDRATLFEETQFSVAYDHFNKLCYESND